MNLGQWIRNVQKEKRITEEECFTRAGMTQPNWSRLVNSPPEHPRRSTMEAVARALEVPVSVVFTAAGFEDHSEPDVRLARQIEPYLMRLCPDRRQIAEQLLIDQARNMGDLLSKCR